MNRLSKHLGVTKNDISCSKASILRIVMNFYAKSIRIEKFIYKSEKNTDV